MWDSRRFADSYDLYRPTVSMSASREQTRTFGDATYSSQPCLYVPTPGAARQTPIGPDLDYDARMLVPVSADVKPVQTGDTPDEVVISGRRFVVLIAWDAAGAGLYKTVLLRERN